MGVAPGINDLSKTNTEFQKYIDEQSKAMNLAASNAKKDMDAAIQNFYKQGNWDDAAPFTSGSYQHLTTAETWSLEHISEMINAIRGAVFGGSVVPPAQNPSNVPTKVGEGTKVEPQKPAVQGAIKQMADMDLLIASAAFDIIQGILTGFTAQANASIVHNFSQKEVAPGLSLFVTVMENEYHRSDFFSDQRIVQNFYIFDCRMSLKRASSIATFNQIQALMNQEAAFQTQTDLIAGKIAAVDVNRDDYDAAIQKLNATLEKLNKFIDDLRIKIKALSEAKRLANAALVKKVLERVRP